MLRRLEVNLECSVILAKRLDTAAPDDRARSRRAAGGAATRLVTRLGLATRLQLVLELPNKHVHH